MLPSLSFHQSFKDERGALAFAQVGSGLPFAPQRYFLVFDVAPGTKRGGHAHLHCDQYLVAVHGTVLVTLDDGRQRSEYLLDHPDQGLHIPAGIWGEQHYVSNDACLLVLASDLYDSEDYISDYSEFVASRKGQP